MPFDQLNVRVIEYHERAFASAGDNARGVDWKSEEAQHLLFRVIRSMGIGEDSSVLDVGCGLAHFYDFLVASGFRGRYTGVDIAPALVGQARARLPGVDLRVLDILREDAPIEPHDFVVASGVFSGRVGTPATEFEEFIEAMIRRMYGLCGVGTIFNMLSSYVDFEVEHLYYADPARYFNLAKSLSRYVDLRHDSPAYFFTLGMYRQANEYADR